MESALRPDDLKGAITWSLIVHGAIALFIILKSLIFPGEPLIIAPALRVDVVGLPDILKKDLSKISTKLPDEVQKEQPKKIEPQPAPKPDEMVLNPKKTKVDKKDEAKREKKLESALARIRALERVKDKEDEEKKDDAVVVKGNQVSKGSSLSGDAKERAEAGYYDLLRDRLVEFWALPTWLSRQNLSAKVNITIDRAGNILSTKFLKKSGNDAFDAEIRKTLEDASPLPKPPANIAGQIADDGVVVGFPL